jgi:hypothetical protein
MARALTAAPEVRALKDALPGVEVTVVLVRASAEVVAERLGRRDQGDVLRGHLAESAAMAAALAEAKLEDLQIDNHGASAGAAAGELLGLLGWA